MADRVKAGVAAALAGVLWLCAPAARADYDDPTALLFSGRDLWRHGAFVYGGFLIAPGGFERDGLMLKVVQSGGLYRYNADSLGVRVYGREATTQVLPGFRIKRGHAEMKFFFGPEWQTHRLIPDDPGNGLRGYATGLRFSGELWWEVTPESLILGDASLTSIASSHTARLAYGRHILEDFDGGFYAGPELQTYASDGYRQFRIGLHLTSLRVEAVEWSAAVGFARDTDRINSPYVRINIAVKK